MVVVVVSDPGRRSAVDCSAATKPATAAERPRIVSMLRMSSSVPTRREDELSPADRQRLKDAHRALRAAYEPFTLGTELQPGQPVPTHPLDKMAKAQAAVEAAERELWRLREELLGWARPSWAPTAASVSDWFSPDDSVYDEVDSGPSR